MLKLTIAAAAILLAITPAFAAKQDFMLHNSTGYDIAEVYVSTTSTNEWEEDVLGKDVLEDEDAVDISFEGAGSACRHDLKVVYSDGDEAMWGDLNLCTISHLELHYDRSTGETSVVAD